MDCFRSIRTQGNVQNDVKQKVGGKPRRTSPSSKIRGRLNRHIVSYQNTFRCALMSNFYLLLYLPGDIFRRHLWNKMFNYTDKLLGHYLLFRL